ncbi:MAG TPA: glutamate--tRNA ligase family protein [Candidatus Paceibacterota bacterium]|nr:glutamate--tRNA ligase family protein [Candidatus Paceibacterota bacterium]
MSQVVTRIPPSPTGRFHLGTARTALFNYLFARHEGGRIVYRSEDTDRTRSEKQFEDEIIEGLHWLGISWDSFSRQSEHSERHRELLENIVSEGKAYISHEPAKDDATSMVDVVRLKNPGRSVTFNDIIRGDITFHTGELGDFVIARSMTDPLYHFAVVADDMDAGVTHVIRGEDHISNTPRQILIQEAIGAPRPAYAHLPLIVDEHRAKLSKRKHVTSIMDYRDEGILPEALVNYLALLGWNPGTDEEYFSLDELVRVFSIDGIQKGSAAWNRDKLLSVNQHWMRTLSDDDFIVRGQLTAPDETKLRKALPLLKERAKTFGEARQMLAEGELASLFTSPSITAEKLQAKALPGAPEEGTRSALEAVLAVLSGLRDGASAEDTKAAIMPLADAAEATGKGGRGAMLWPLRYALSGLDRSPDPFTLISILGKEESISRIRAAIGILE